MPAFGATAGWAAGCVLATTVLVSGPRLPVRTPRAFNCAMLSLLKLFTSCRRCPRYARAICPRLCVEFDVFGNPDSKCWMPFSKGSVGVAAVPGAAVGAESAEFPAVVEFAVPAMAAKFDGAASCTAKGVPLGL